jgi:hypothetical protein
MALQKCKECGKEISSDAKTCPQCGKPQPKRSPWGCAIIAVIFLFIMISALSNQTPSTPDTPPAGSDPASATDAQIYREFEICMNSAKKQIGDNKLEARRVAAGCMMQLEKYGKKRAKKAFDLYYDL